MEKFRTVEEVCEDCGGAEAITAFAIEAGLIERDKPFHPSTIVKWRHNGIPEKLWSIFIKHAGATADELHQMNEWVRGLKRE